MEQFTKTAAVYRRRRETAPAESNGGKARLLAVNSDIHIDAYAAEGTAETLEPLIEQADCIVDATDNFETRMVINDLALKTETPWIYGACVSSQECA